MTLAHLALLAALAGQPEDGNLLINGSFEEPAEEPAQLDPHRLSEWWSFAGPERPYWRGFERTDERAIDGDYSVKLTLDSDSNPTSSSLIVGAIQNLDIEAMPEELSGWVRVEDWKRGTMRQYVQIVVIVWDVTGNFPPERQHRNYQVAYTFGGVEKPPLEIANRKFQLLNDALELDDGNGGVVEDEWVRFDLNPREDFKRLWGVDPSDYKYIRVLYEVRYDGRDNKFEPDAKAHVYWDGLHFGADLNGEADWPLEDEAETE
ncbi:MAG: hypothetical protein Phyf2KO_22840 [Phycisphaerales bacterium]